MIKAVAKTLASTLHIVVPVIVILAALALHFLHNPLSVPMFLAMVCSAFGPKMLHDFLSQKMVTATLNETTNTVRNVAETVVHEVRDVARGVQPTP